MIDVGVTGISDLPERICIETRLITHEFARMQNLNFFDLRHNRIEKEPWIPKETTGTIAPFVNSRTMVSTEVMTENPNPLRHRSIQTCCERKTISTQCDLFKEDLEMEFEKQFGTTSISSEPNKDLEARKERFENFIKVKSYVYTNGKRECMICGEIKKNAQLMESHMALHWGPQKLCSRCGICFEHQSLWKHHNCVQKRPSKKLQYIKCPHYLCAASVISPLELYDHLNEHCGIFLHKCASCGTSFTTAGELRYHLKIHKQCRCDPCQIRPSEVYNVPAEDAKCRRRVFLVSSENKKQFVMKTFLSQLALRQRCNPTRHCYICLRPCRSLSQYQLHVKRCLNLHRRRLKNKRIKEALFIKGTTNGYQ